MSKIELSTLRNIAGFGWGFILGFTVFLPEPEKEKEEENSIVDSKEELILTIESLSKVDAELSGNTGIPVEIIVKEGQIVEDGGFFYVVKLAGIAITLSTVSYTIIKYGISAYKYLKPVILSSKIALESAINNGYPKLLEKLIKITKPIDNNVIRTSANLAKKWNDIDNYIDEIKKNNKVPTVPNPIFGYDEALPFQRLAVEILEDEKEVELSDKQEVEVYINLISKDSGELIEVDMRDSKIDFLIKIQEFLYKQFRMGTFLTEKRKGEIESTNPDTIGTIIKNYFKNKLIATKDKKILKTKESAILLILYLKAKDAFIQLSSQENREILYDAERNFTDFAFTEGLSEDQILNIINMDIESLRVYLHNLYPYQVYLKPKVVESTEEPKGEQLKDYTGMEGKEDIEPEPKITEKPTEITVPPQEILNNPRPLAVKIPVGRNIPQHSQGSFTVVKTVPKGDKPEIKLIKKGNIVGFAPQDNDTEIINQGSQQSPGINDIIELNTPEPLVPFSGGGSNIGNILNIPENLIRPVKQINWRMFVELNTNKFNGNSDYRFKYLKKYFGDRELTIQEMLKVFEGNSKYGFKSRNYTEGSLFYDRFLNLFNGFRRFLKNPTNENIIKVINSYNSLLGVSENSIRFDSEKIAEKNKIILAQLREYIVNIIYNSPGSQKEEESANRQNDIVGVLTEKYIKDINSIKNFSELTRLINLPELILRSYIGKLLLLYKKPKNEMYTIDDNSYKLFVGEALRDSKTSILEYEAAIDELGVILTEIQIKISEHMGQNRISLLKALASLFRLYLSLIDIYIKIKDIKSIKNIGDINIEQGRYDNIISNSKKLTIFIDKLLNDNNIDMLAGGADNMIKIMSQFDNSTFIKLLNFIKKLIKFRYLLPGQVQNIVDKLISEELLFTLLSFKRQSK